MPRPHRLPRRGALPHALTAAAVLLLTACGQRGPLYLPTDPAAVGRPTLPEILVPGAPARPTTPVNDLPGNTGTGTANPVRTP